MIKEVEIKANGGPEKILWKDCELSKLSSGQVTIKHTFVGHNFIDTYHRSGLYPLPLPTKLGMEGAGVIVDMASDVSDFEVGDRVAYVMALGSYSTHRNIDANKLVKIPKSISDQLGPYFPGRIKLDTQTLILRNGRILPLQVGMSLKANIKLRRVSYLKLLLGTFKDKSDSLKQI